MKFACCRNTVFFVEPRFLCNSERETVVLGRPTPLLTVVLAFLFCAYNGFMQAHALINMPRIIHNAPGLQVLGLIGTPGLLLSSESLLNFYNYFFVLKSLFSYRALMHKFLQLVSNMYMFAKTQINMDKTRRNLFVSRHHCDKCIMLRSDINCFYIKISSISWRKRSKSRSSNFFSPEKKNTIRINFCYQFCPVTMAWCFVAVFCCGLGVNIHSDHILRNLRKPGESTYKIPHGGLFNLISAPNYLGNFWSHLA